MPSQYARALYESVKGKAPDDAKASIRRLAEILNQRQESKRLPQIIAAFENIWSLEENEWSAELTSASFFSESEKEALAAYWGKHFRRPGVRLQFSESIDQELLGGFRLQAGGRILDASLRTALEELKSKLAA